MADLAMPVDSYMALIGSNGAGKSSVLYALDWFFNGGELDERDIHRPRTDDSNAHPLAESVEVEVTFSALTDRDREVLGIYGRGTVARLTRHCVPPGKSQLSGCSIQGPGFAKVRCAANAIDRRAAYSAARKLVAGLPAVSSERDINAALEAWEDSPDNAIQMVDEPDSTMRTAPQSARPATADLIRYVLIPASGDLASEVGTLGRGSALGELMGGLLSRVVSEARADWEETHSHEIDKLRAAMAAGVHDATSAHATRINGRLGDLLPNASIVFAPEVPTWQLRGDAGLRTTVKIDGASHDIERQGHGVQRAVMMAVLQAFVPSGEDASSADTTEEADTAALIVAIEEPEIYQHPVRARHFGRSLTRLSDKPNTQVFIASHSPYFIRPEQFESLRRVSLKDGVSIATSTTIADIAKGAGITDSKVLKRLEAELPRTFSEGFFADVAVLVEGDTDRVIIETLAERLDLALDARGIAVLPVGGKEGLRLAAEVLRQLGTRTFVVVDGDALGPSRKSVNKRAEAEKSYSAATNEVLSWLQPKTALHGTVPARYGDATAVGPNYLFLHDDLETELDGWSAFTAERNLRSIQVRDKNVAGYRAAAFSASLDGLPSVFRKAIEAMVALQEEVSPRPPLIPEALGLTS